MATTVCTIDTGHEDMIHDSQMDYYGRRLATCSSDGVIKVFDVVGEQFTLLEELKGHSGAVWQLAWAHPSFGNILASCSYDGRVIIWREESGSFVPFYTHEFGPSVNSISWAPHELQERSIACGSADGHIYILTLKDGGDADVTQIKDAHLTGVLSVSWAPLPSFLPSQSVPKGMKRLVSGGCDCAIRLFRFTEKWEKEEEELPKHGDWVRDVAWAPGIGSSLASFASCSQDGNVFIWTQDKASPGKWNQQQLRKFDNAVWRVSWSLTGGILAVSSADNKVTLWKEAIDGEWKCVSDIDASS